jgi:hypothetical protein
MSIIFFSFKKYIQKLTKMLRLDLFRRSNFKYRERVDRLSFVKLLTGATTPFPFFEGAEGGYLGLKLM